MTSANKSELLTAAPRWNPLGQARGIALSMGVALIAAIGLSAPLSSPANAQCIASAASTCNGTGNALHLGSTINGRLKFSNRVQHYQRQPECSPPGL